MHLQRLKMPSVPDFHLPVRRIPAPSGHPTHAAQRIICLPSNATYKALKAADIARVDKIVDSVQKAVTAKRGGPWGRFTKSSCSWCGGWLRSGEVGVHNHCMQDRQRSEERKKL